MQAARRRNPSSSYILVEFGFSFTMLSTSRETNQSKTGYVNDAKLPVFGGSILFLTASNFYIPPWWTFSFFLNENKTDYNIFHQLLERNFSLKWTEESGI